MTQYKNVKSQTRPESVVVLNDNVYVAKNIVEYTDVIDETHSVSGYKYDCEKYTLTEYFQLISSNSEDKQRIAELEEELAAAKILLGVE